MIASLFSRVKITSPAELENGMICINAQDDGFAGAARPDHALVFKGRDRAGDASAYHSTSERDGSDFRGESFSEVEESFFKRPSLRAFKINNEPLRQSFESCLKGAQIKFSIFKVVGATLRDLVSSEETRQEDVAEKVAKYYHKSHAAKGVEMAGGQKAANVFCSQFVYQSLQNAMVEQELGGAENLGVENDGQIRQGFTAWRAENIDKIRGAVRNLPPEMKHISASISPARLVSALDGMASRRQEEEKLAAQPKAEKPGFFTRFARIAEKLFGFSKASAPAPAPVEVVEDNSTNSELPPVESPIEKPVELEEINLELDPPSDVPEEPAVKFKEEIETEMHPPAEAVQATQCVSLEDSQILFDATTNGAETSFAERIAQERSGTNSR